MGGGRHTPSERVDRPRCQPAATMGTENADARRACNADAACTRCSPGADVAETNAATGSWSISVRRFCQPTRLRMSAVSTLVTALPPDLWITEFTRRLVGSRLNLAGCVHSTTTPTLDDLPPKRARHQPPCLHLGAWPAGTGWVARARRRAATPFSPGEHVVGGGNVRAAGRTSLPVPSHRLPPRCGWSPAPLSGARRTDYLLLVHDWLLGGEELASRAESRRRVCAR